MVTWDAYEVQRIGNDTIPKILKPVKPFCSEDFEIPKEIGLMIFHTFPVEQRAFVGMMVPYSCVVRMKVVYGTRSGFIRKRIIA